MSDKEIDTLIASFYCINEDDEYEAPVDLEILTEEDRAALDALGDDLVGRLLKESTQCPPNPATKP
jgi:hypothetical protein